MWGSLSASGPSKQSFGSSERITSVSMTIDMPLLAMNSLLASRSTKMKEFFYTNCLGWRKNSSIRAGGFMSLLTIDCHYMMTTNL